MKEHAKLHMSTNFHPNPTIFQFSPPGGARRGLKSVPLVPTGQNNPTIMQRALYDAPFGRYSQFCVLAVRTLGLENHPSPGSNRIEFVHAIRSSGTSRLCGRVPTEQFRPLPLLEGRLRSHFVLAGTLFHGSASSRAHYAPFGASEWHQNTLRSLRGLLPLPKCVGA